MQSNSPLQLFVRAQEEALKKVLYEERRLNIHMDKYITATRKKGETPAFRTSGHKGDNL